MKRALLLSLVSVAACGEEPTCPAASLPALDETPTYAVVTSDYTSTAIALLSSEGELLDEAWVDSGSAEAGIVAALSGDVSLPSEPLAPGELTLIDRFGVDVVGRFDLLEGRVLSQIDVQLDPLMSSVGFRSNPQDVLLHGDGSLLVSRFEPNPDPAAPALDAGNDLVRLDEGGPFSRIAFDDLNTTVAGTTTYARPGRIARLGATIVVGLGRLSIDFASAAPGAVAIVTIDPPAVVALELPGLTNCPSVQEAPEGDAIIVLCQGQTFEAAGGRRAGAGIARLVEGAAGLSIADLWRAAEHPEAPVPTLEPVPIGGDRVVFPALGDASIGDRLAIVDLVTGEVEVLHEAEREFVIGVGTYDASTSLLLIPDADVGVLRFRVEGAALRALGAVDVSPCRGLPPREIGRLQR